MKENFYVKLHNDKLLEFRYVYTKIIDSLLSKESWAELSEYENKKTTIPFSFVGTNGKDYVAKCKTKSLSQYGFIFSNDLFLKLISENKLVFFTPPKCNFERIFFMEILSNEEICILKKNHLFYRIMEEKKFEKYYKSEDNRFLMEFNDGTGELFMTMEDLKAMDDL